ncbi:MAG: tetratricopeptide repeat protein [Spirochaetota bacterium]
MSVDSVTLSMLEQYNKGLELYKQRKFEEAKKYFEKALEIKPGDGPSQLYIERCEEFIKNPPPKDWDGVFTFTTK